jgi:hypothetical protein
VRRNAITLVAVFIAAVGSAGAAAGTAAAQQPAGAGAAGCEFWTNPPGFSGDADRSRTACSLTRRPLPLFDTLSARLPQGTKQYFATLHLVVRRDGTVDSMLTRMWSASSTGADIAGFSLEDTAMAALRRVRFAPGSAGDTAVRTALELEITVPEAPDSVPATARWRYVVGAKTDTFRVEWTTQRALSPGTVREQAEVLLVTMAELRVIRTYGRLPIWRGCFDLAAAMPEREAIARALTAAGAALTGAPDCPAGEESHAAVFTRLSKLDEHTYVEAIKWPGGIMFTGPRRCRTERRSDRWVVGC